jgi:hypothetical protein
VGPSAVRTFVVGVAFIAVMIGALVFAVRANGGLPVGEHTTARVAFRDVGPLLHVGAQVIPQACAHVIPQVVGSVVMFYPMASLVVSVPRPGLLLGR